MKLGKRAIQQDFLFKLFKANILYIIHFFNTFKICKKQQYIDQENYQYLHLKERRWTFWLQAQFFTQTCWAQGRQKTVWFQQQHYQHLQNYFQNLSKQQTANKRCDEWFHNFFSPKSWPFNSLKRRSQTLKVFSQYAIHFFFLNLQNKRLWANLSR